ncbi:hypothetical protein AAC387_Pa03g0363 [Persea americana]
MDAEEDEFGDLYTDVLRPSSSSSAPIPSLLPSSKPSLDLNASEDDDEDDLILYGKNPSFNGAPRDQPKPSSPTQPDELEEPPRVSAAPALDLVQEDQIRAQDDEKDRILTEERIGIEVGIGDLDSDQPMIPGLSTGAFVPAVFDASEANGGGVKAKDGEDEEDDWDSDDSEDDLQIVLNETLPIGAEQEDEDGEDLVIVADGDQHIPGIEEQEWGEEATQASADGDRKEGGEAAKVGGGGGIAMVGPGGARIGYSNHGYHPHHSQFKYVRPGATIVPGGAVAGGAAPGQVRPPVTMGSIPGRGRGDWRPIGMNKSLPTMQKNFHSGFGLPIWANNSSGRGFGTGMEFTLPSHKTVFDIDIDSFEEKPWRYPGVDTSDYFNFGLDEDNWKDYCKQLGQLRLEATMQSKIRVYESGRSEQDYDPDLPPELAAAAGLHDVSVENSHLGKTDSGLMDLAGQGRGATRTRPQLPTGRAIQVEGGYGERLPSIDTRPPRVRDSDAIIEIVLQDSVDDDSIVANGEQPEDETQVDLKGGGHEFQDDERQADAEYFDQFPPTYNGRKGETVTRRAPFTSSIQNNKHEGDGLLPFPSAVPLQYRPSSNVQTSIYPGGLFNTPPGGRWPQGTGHERLSHTSAEHGNEVIPSRSARNRSDVNPKEKLRASVEGKQTPEALSPVAVEAAREQSVEQKDNLHDDGPALADSVEEEEVASDLGEDGSLHLSVEKRKLSSRVEQPAVEEIGSGDDLRTNYSDNSKAKSWNSRDFQKRHDGGDEEVAQDARSRRTGEGKSFHDEDNYSYRRRDEHNRDSKEIDINRTIAKGREDLYDSYPNRDWDSSSAHYKRAKTESIERPKDRDGSVVFYQKRDDDKHGRRAKDEEMRRPERIEDTGSRHRSKLRESERIDRDEHLHSKRRVDDREWRSSHDKDSGPRHRERDDVLLGRHEIMDDAHVRKRKDEELQRREHVDKEDVLHGYRAREDTSRRKRERDDGLDHRRREDQARARDKVDDHHSIRHRDESWRVREREDRIRPKQSQEDIHSNRDREEGRSSIRSGRLSEDKQWVGNSRAKDEPKGLGSDRDYQNKDKRRESEHPKRRDRVEEDTSSHHRVHDDTYARENQFKDRNIRQDKSSTQNDRLINNPYSQRMSKDRHKENSRKSKESEGGDHHTQILGKRKHDDHNAHRNEKVSTKGTSEQESGTLGHRHSRDHSHPRSSSAALSKKGHHHLQHEQRGAPEQQHSSRKHGEDADSEDEQQNNSRRGRSKLERWASQKEKDDITNVQSPTPSSKGRESGRNNDKFLASRQPDEVGKKGGDSDTLISSVGPENASDMELKDVDLVAESDDQHIDADRTGDDRHMDTFEKLKKRSERFKLPMPGEKDGSTNKKVESNEILLPHSETAVAEPEVKQERPARKRRWNYKDLE